MMQRLWHDTAVRHGILLFVVLRLFLSGWAGLALAVNPIPAEADEVLRPYLGQPILQEGAAGALLGPWQRFDALRYTQIAAEGYANEANSVFPLLYPLSIRLLGIPLGGAHSARMTAAIFISNLACLGLFILLHKVAASECSPKHAPRSLLYFALFPSAFFLFAPYSEALFLLLALASMWAARHGRFGLAGGLGLLASFTRLTGWVLVVPLAYEWWRQRQPRTARSLLAGWVVLLPGLGTAVFLLYRWAIGLPPLATIYSTYWYQRTGFPGADLLRALQTMVGGGIARVGEFTLWFDFFCVLLLLITTVLAFRRLGITWGLYAAMMLLFMLLPTSELKPLYSFSRYALAFFPTFLILGQWGQNRWLHRLILYTSLLLYLWFSGQFFMWGWVA